MSSEVYCPWIVFVNEAMSIARKGCVPPQPRTTTPHIFSGFFSELEGRAGGWETKHATGVSDVSQCEMAYMWRFECLGNRQAIVAAGQRFDIEILQDRKVAVNSRNQSPYIRGRHPKPDAAYSATGLESK
jgi:hypothetical protein